LKKCCESLTEENKRLQKEVQELKSMQAMAMPLYMQIPAATLSLCPSCERISATKSEDENANNTTSSLLFPSKTHHHHFYKSNYPFSHSSSAAC